MPEQEKGSWVWKFVLILEVMAIAIAAVLPVTPSKTGSDSELADYLLTDPTYPEKVAVYFVLLNAVMACIWLIYFVRTRLIGQKSSGVEP